MKEKIQDNFRAKLKKYWGIIKEETKRTWAICKKMFSASRANGHLHEAYQKLGLMTAEAIESGEFSWENPKVHELIQLIKDYKNDLKNYEKEVKDLKTKKIEIVSK